MPPVSKAHQYQEPSLPSSQLPRFEQYRFNQDGYNLLFGEEIGSGAYGAVYRAVSPVYPSRVYAVKCISTHKSNDHRRLLHEREFSTHKMACSHPNIVNLYKVFRMPGYTFMVMDFLPYDLYEILVHKRVYCGNQKLTTNIFCQLLDAVAYIHSLGITHRDIKPENILVTDDTGSNVKLADFGYATFDSVSGRFGYGSSVYRSPECDGILMPWIPEGEELTVYPNEPVDIWSLAVVFIVTITIRGLWSHSNLADDGFTSYIQDPLKYLRSTLPLSMECCDILIQMLALDPTDRPTARDLYEQVRNVQRWTLKKEEIWNSPYPTIQSYARDLFGENLERLDTECSDSSPHSPSGSMVRNTLPVFDEPTRKYALKLAQKEREDKYNAHTHLRELNKRSAAKFIKPLTLTSGQDKGKRRIRFDLPENTRDYNSSQVFSSSHIFHKGLLDQPLPDLHLPRPRRKHHPTLNNESADTSELKQDLSRYNSTNSEERNAAPYQRHRRTSKSSVTGFWTNFFGGSQMQTQDSATRKEVTPTTSRHRRTPRGLLGDFFENFKSSRPIEERSLEVDSRSSLSSEYGSETEVTNDAITDPSSRGSSLPTSPVHYCRPSSNAINLNFNQLNVGEDLGVEKDECHAVYPEVNRNDRYRPKVLSRLATFHR